MKKSWLAALVFLFILGACGTVISEPETTKAAITNIAWPSYIPENIRLEPEGYVYLDDWGTVAKYRAAYYGYRFVGLGDREKEIEISNLLRERHYDADGRFIETDEMDLVAIVKYCEIAKEDFVAALQEEQQWALSLRPYDDIEFDREDAEFPNPDIIYTFDNDIINAYYRRENPVAPDWSKTTVYESYAAYKEANP